MITKKELKMLCEELLSSAKPLIFFDDDPDGTASYILFYKFLKGYVDDVRGIIVKSGPELEDEMFVRNVHEYDPDKVFVLDKPILNQDFVDQLHKPVVWLDHHPLLERRGVRYYNPLKHKSKKYVPDNRPTSYWAYEAVKNENDMWIAMVGCTSDWFIPDFYKKFSEKYPELLPKDLKIKNPGTVLYETKLGLLCKIIGFNLKYSSKDAMTAVKILSRITDPLDIIDQRTPEGKYLYKKYLHINEVYERVKSWVKITPERLVLCEYENMQAFSKELSNDLMYAYPEKFILIARKKNDRYICSLRAEKFNVREIQERALVGIDGYGGGHEHACGGAVKEHDWQRFLENLRRELKSHTK